ncbi:MAG: hypothetical protein ACI8Z9_001125 [Paraglaciecola sp.]|jgi:hypothetical protein
MGLIIKHKTTTSPKRKRQFNPAGDPIDRLFTQIFKLKAWLQHPVPEQK